MDDKDIIKALRCCVKFKSCNECPLNGCYVFESECKHKLTKLVYELVQKQNEMIDALIAGQETLQKWMTK